MPFMGLSMEKYSYLNSLNRLKENHSTLWEVMSTNEIFVRTQQLSSKCFLPLQKIFLKCTLIEKYCYFTIIEIIGMP